MRRLTPGTFALLAAAVLLVGCDSSRSLEPLSASDEAAQAKGGPPQVTFATLTTLPNLGGPSEAHAIDATGTVVVGHSFNRAGYRYAVKWKFQGGSWVISTLQGPGLAAYAAQGVSDQGVVAGYFGSSPMRAVQWSSLGAIADLGCLTDVGPTIAYAISADGQTVVGTANGAAAVWQTTIAGSCRVSLPTLAAASAHARTVNGNGTIVGGGVSVTQNSSVPVRWTLTAAGWGLQTLDSRSGGVRGANAQGDLAGYVSDPCTQNLGCSHAMVWYAAGQALDLGTLGSDYNVATDINSAGEVVGVNSTSAGRSTAFIWSSGAGVRLLPAKASDAGANAVSEVRGDGTRVAAGQAGAKAVVWVIR